MNIKEILNKRWHRIVLHETRRRVAKVWLKINFQKTVIGVTGSYGKTSTVRAITQILSQKYQTLQTDINLDTLYNLPITSLKLRPKHKFLILEYGIDKLNEMDFHLWLVKPKIGVLTGITPVHADNEHLGSLEKIIQEKSKLLKALPVDGYAILNNDDENVKKMAKETKANIVWYGTSPECQIWSENIKTGPLGTTFTAHFNYLNWPKTSIFRTGLVGEHLVQGCLVSIFIGKLYGLEDRAIDRVLRDLKPLKGRLSLEKGPKETILLDDHLRANLASTLAGLETFGKLPGKRKIAILGEMGEMGRYAEIGHREIGKKAAALKIDYLFCVGPYQKETAKAALENGMKKDQVIWENDVLKAGEILRGIVKKGDSLYLKGSLLRHLERILLLLKGKKVLCRKVNCHTYKQCQDCSDLLVAC
jgi:UDP-N-acetylmuramoyl-tripeptide--D-alanyl-D-alanine ligase